MKAYPCDRLDRNRLADIVDDAVENRPLVNPTVVDVETYPAAVEVNGNADDEPDEIHVLLIAKHPPVRLNPTSDVEVAWPEMFRPERVVVPNPDPDIVRADVDVVAVPATVVVPMYRLPPAFLKKNCAIPAPADRDSCGFVVEARVRRLIFYPTLEICLAHRRSHKEIGTCGTCC
jgi:hypothetical protein